MPNRIAAREIVAVRIREARIQRELSQEMLADLCGLHRTYIGTVERAESGITVDSLDRIALGLGLETWELLKPLDAPSEAIV